MNRSISLDIAPPRSRHTGSRVINTRRESIVAPRRAPTPIRPAPPVALPAAQPLLVPEPAVTPVLTPAVPEVAPSEPTITRPKTGRTASIKAALVFGVKGLLVAAAGVAAFQLLNANILDSLMAAYLVMAILYRIDSFWSFGLALVLLVMVPVSTVIGLSALAANYAVFVFYFLAIGLISALLEVRGEDGLVGAVAA